MKIPHIVSFPFSKLDDKTLLHLVFDPDMETFHLIRGHIATTTTKNFQLFHICSIYSTY